MKDELKLEQIAKQIEKKANEEERIMYDDQTSIERYQDAKRWLQKYSSIPEKEVTFTIGELNAYMG